MVFHRNQAQFARARWRRAVLFPLWCAQVALLLGIIGVFSYRLAETVEHFDENHRQGKVPTVELVWEGVNVGFAVVCLVLTIMEAARLLAETLTPYFLLASHVVKMTCAAAILALDIVVYTERSEGDWSSVGLALDVALLAAMLALGVYAIVRFRQLLRASGDDYHHPANNVKAFGFGGGRGGGYDEIGIEMERGVGGGSTGPSGDVASGDVFLRASPYNDLPTEYDPAAAGGGGTRSRSHSAASSIRGRLSFSGGGAAAAPAASRPSLSSTLDDGRRASYNHERDTQFDDYVLTRGSAALSKDDIDQALSAELWGAPAGRGGGGTSTAPAHVVARANSVVASGAVAGRHHAATATVVASPREGVNRAVSWSVEPGLVSVPESIQEEEAGAGAGVASIAEAHDEDDDDEHDDNNDILTHGRYRAKGGANEDRALLLGHSRSPSEDGEDDHGRGLIRGTGFA